MSTEVVRGAVIPCGFFVAAVLRKGHTLADHKLLPLQHLGGGPTTIKPLTTLPSYRRGDIARPTHRPDPEACILNTPDLVLLNIVTSLEHMTPPLRRRDGPEIHPGVTASGHFRLE